LMFCPSALDIFVSSSFLALSVMVCFKGLSSNVYAEDRL
jgi:hypothetical protein